MHPPPPLLNPDTGTDIVGFFITVIIPLLMGLLVSSDKARQAAQAILGLYKVYKAFRERMQPAPKPQPVTNGNGNGNGNGHANGNGGQSELMKSVLQNLRVEADARESGDQTLEMRLREVTERGRRDSDNFYMLFHDIDSETKALKSVTEAHTSKIITLEAEQIAVRNQMTAMVREQRTTNEKLQSILHLLDPKSPPPTPQGDEILLLDNDDDLEATG